MEYLGPSGSQSQGNGRRWPCSPAIGTAAELVKKETLKGWLQSRQKWSTKSGIYNDMTCKWASDTVGNGSIGPSTNPLNVLCTTCSFLLSVDILRRQQYPAI